MQEVKKPPEEILRAREIITGYMGKEIRIMEVCGTHTHEIFRQGIRSLLPPDIRLISGPGCPVCVTPADFIDEALWLIEKKHATICTSPRNKEQPCRCTNPGGTDPSDLHPVGCRFLREGTPVG